MQGRTLAHYRILDMLGEGGMGAVYEALDTRLDRRVALKVLPEQMASDPERLRRFEREAKAVAAMNHPNVVTIYSVEKADDIHFLTMELVEGETLASAIPSGGLTLDRFFEIALPLTKALNAAHSQGIAHRDLKPSNVMINSDGRVKILDFGLAKLVEIDPKAGASEDLTLVASAELTLHGQILGTVPYMSPEQVRGQRVDHRSDLFSLGVIFYEMAIGQRPFQGNTSVDLMSSILTESPQPVSDLNAELPRHLGRIIGLCLEKDIARRVQTARDVGNQLQALKRELDSGATVQTGAVAPVEAAPPRHRWPLPTAAALAVLALGVAGVWLYQQRGSSPPIEAVGRPGLAARSSVAVFGFKNLGQPEGEWLSTALAEMLSTDLASGESLRVVPGEAVARARHELKLPGNDTFALDTLRRIRDHLGTDYVVLGSYLALEAADGVQLRLQLRMQDTRAGETRAALAETAPQSELFDLVTSVGARVRQELGLSEVTDQQAAAVRATLSSNPEATRLYSKGLDALRGYDAISAREFLAEAVELDPGYALAHSALSRAWGALGYQARAEASSRRALDLGEGLPRGEYLEIQGHYHEVAHDWPQALEAYQVLWGFFPDNLEYGLQLASVQTLAGQPQDTLVTVEKLRNLPEPDGDSPRIDLAAIKAFRTLSDFKQVGQLAERAAAAARRMGASSLNAEALYHHGFALRQLGQPELALKALEESARLYEAAGDRGNLAAALGTRAILVADSGQTDAAYDLFAEALAISREIGDQTRIATLLNNMAMRHLERGELAEARRKMEDSLATVREIGDREKETRRLSNLGWILFSQGELEAAERRAVEARAASEALGRRGGIAAAQLLLGDLTFAAGRLEEARASYDEALALYVELERTGGQGYVQHSLGRLLTARGDLAGAAQALETAARIQTDLATPALLAETQLAQAELLLASADATAAEASARASAAEFDTPSKRDNRARSLAVLASTLAEQGRGADASSEISAAREAARGSEDPTVSLVVGLAEAHSLRLAGDAAGAVTIVSPVAEKASALGFVGLALEARLELASAGLATGDAAAANEALVALAAEADAAGYGLVADRARRARAAGAG